MIPAKLAAAFSLLLTLRRRTPVSTEMKWLCRAATIPITGATFREDFRGIGKTLLPPKAAPLEQQDMFAYVQSLLTLRKEHPALRTGKQVHIGWDGTYYAFVRELPEEKLLVVYNNAVSPRALEIPIDGTPLESAQEIRVDLWE